MKRTVFAIVALIVIAPVGPSKGGHYVRDLRAADVNAADDATLVPIVLRVTDHPPVPRDLSQFWMVPDSRRPRTAAQANLATAVKFENEGNHAKALTLLTNPATRQDAALASYAEFYKGLALLQTRHGAFLLAADFARGRIDVFDAAFHRLNLSGRFFHDHGMIRRADNGLLEFKVGGASLLFEGWLLLAEGQLFAILFDTVGQTPIFVIWNGVPLSKASFLDGIVMAAALNAARVVCS